MARSHDMTSGSIWRSLLGFSIPIMISNLVQSTYNAVDMLFVGRFTGTESLAAVSVCGPILNVMIITLSGMSAGGAGGHQRPAGCGRYKAGAGCSPHQRGAVCVDGCCYDRTGAFCLCRRYCGLCRLRPPRCRRQSGTCIRCLREPCSPLDIT